MLLPQVVARERGPTSPPIEHSPGTDSCGIPISNPVRYSNRGLYNQVRTSHQETPQLLSTFSLEEHIAGNVLIPGERIALRRRLGTKPQAEVPGQ